MKMRDCEIRTAKPSGGKAGKGKNKTSSVMVLCWGCIMKTYRFDVNDPGSKSRAMSKAQAYVRQRSQPA